FIKEELFTFQQSLLFALTCNTYVALAKIFSILSLLRNTRTRIERSRNAVTELFEVLQIGASG
ncbi:MAG: hypothetical protein WCX14_02780, partial [Dysgonamonadaceae bacterium]